MPPINGPNSKIDMKKFLLILATLILTLGVSAQVKRYIRTRLGVVDQIKNYGRVSYRGLNYYPMGKDSLLVREDMCQNDSVIIPQILTIDKKPYTVCGFKDMAFEYNHYIRYVSIPSSVGTISGSCFYQCHYLSECVMPGVKVIEGYAFWGTAFERIAFPEGLEYIGDYAFRECRNLRYVEFPSTLRKIDQYAFSGCEIDTIKVNFTTPAQLRPGALSTRAKNYNQESTVLMVPKGSKHLFESDKYWKYFRDVVEF